jgi:hypothetical protein
MILSIILITVGSGLMILGILMLWEWLSGESKIFEAAGYDGGSSRQSDLVFMDLYFLVLVVAPLLSGGIMIVVGLARLS